MTAIFDKPNLTPGSGKGGKTLSTIDRIKASANYHPCEHKASGLSRIFPALVHVCRDIQYSVAFSLPNCHHTRSAIFLRSLTSGVCALCAGHFPLVSAPSVPVNFPGSDHYIRVALFPSIRRYDLHHYAVRQARGTLPRQVYPARPDADLSGQSDRMNRMLPSPSSCKPHFHYAGWNGLFLSGHKLHRIDQVR